MKLPVEGDNWHQVIRSDKLKLGKKKMRNIGLKSIMLLRQESTVHATDAPVSYTHLTLPTILRV